MGLCFVRPCELKEDGGTNNVDRILVAWDQSAISRATAILDRIQFEDPCDSLRKQIESRLQRVGILSDPEIVSSVSFCSNRSLDGERS